MESGLVFWNGIELDGLVDKKCTKKLFITILKQHRKWPNIKEEHKCDLIICFHICYNYKMSWTIRICDLQLAAATKDIDLIMADTHTW
jgi:5'-nucleotidase